MQGFIFLGRGNLFGMFCFLGEGGGNSFSEGDEADVEWST